MNELNLEEYDKIDTLAVDFEFKIGDIIYHRGSKKIEVIIEKDTDIIQVEAYPLVENFGCSLLRKKCDKSTI